MAVPPVTSHTLLGGLRASQPEAWARLVRLYRPLVEYWAGRGGLTGADVEDVCQEVFRELLTALPEFRHDRPGDTFRGWLRGVTRNVLLRHLRMKNRQPAAGGGSECLDQLHAVADVVPPEQGDPPAEVNALYRRAMEVVRGEFEGRTWGLFWACVVDGRKPGDVAAELGVGAAAVRQAKSRVLRRLKEVVGDVPE